ncbi:hypothetical protein [Vibrio furnissii]|uniref:hypothetical protein n=1 Tax=Vibrio furnissii TaxID=29494 RepID=UPI000200DC9D|nr:hypothetical protein [Vibrio furnissii]ADT89256.1 hypothetical protein vfu_B01060 [Vibrio furnissii NCTC 11218]
MDKSQYLLKLEIDQLRHRIESEPQQVLAVAEQCLTRAKQIEFSDGILQSLIIMSRCLWCDMDYRAGLKTIKQAFTYQNSLETDDYLPEILHVHALHFWGQAKYYSAQQFWINALEQAALVEENEILIECLIGLGNVWRITNEHKLAGATHELAVKVANNTRIHWLEGKARILWAWDLYLLNQYVEMLTVLDGAEEALRGHPDRTWQAEVWDFRGLALLGLERLSDAEEATQRAHELAVKHDLVWMKAHSFISRARLELLRKNLDHATELLQLAEASADKFDNGELLSQICYQQSRVAEEQGDFRAALAAFRKYRQFSTAMLREQTIRAGLDKARASKRQLEQRARKLINRVRAQHEYDPEKHLSNVVSETYWWEQMVQFKAELQHATHSVIVIQHNDAHFLDVCTELVHSLCASQDLLSRLSSQRLGLLLAEKDDAAQQVYQTLLNMLAIYPWQRKGLSDEQPIVTLHSILSFPFTLEQLEEMSPQEESYGSSTQ